jgi:tRNA-dihydrouridine synthase 1
MVETQCDAVDLNLGCPQGIAKKGKYGSWLQDEWDLIADMVSILHKNLAVPVTVKIRVFTDLEKTIKYAKMIENAGAQMLTVHGRLREQKGQNTGIADWDKIKAVKEAVSIPVIANGNILYHQDIQKCLDYTGCDGVMTAEGSLYNPAIFSNKYNELPAFTYDMAEEYMDIAKQVDCRTGLIKGHLFKILQPSLRVHTDLRAKLGKSHTFEDYSAVVAELKGRLIKEFNEQGEEDFQGQLDDKGIRKYAHWRCQPYVRPEGSENNAKSKKENKQEKKREATEQIDSEKDVKKLKQDDQVQDQEQEQQQQ